ncbi:MAG: hypothetical protein N2C12_07075, partial [Planctomycetales bacterium]
MRTLLGAICIATLALAWISTSYAQQADAGNVILTDQTQFTIPFTIAPTSDPLEEPLAVQLMLSRDEGNSWQKVGQVKPEDRMFKFRANRDGKYWYRVQTIARDGQIAPQEVNGPELKVVVDTVQPELNLSARYGPNGKVEMEWSAGDEHLDGATLVIECLVDQQWQSLPLNPPVASERGQVVGIQSWDIPGASLIRASIFDQAGNRASGQAAIQKPARGTGDPVTPPSQNPAAEYSAVTDNAVSNDAVANQLVAHVVDSPKFDLPYSTDLSGEAGGVSGIVKVDLWSTLDDGRTWHYHDTDLDRITPFPVVVPDDGFYGFRLVIYRNNGVRD